MQEYRMKIDELLKLHEATAKYTKDVMERKNHDYTVGSKDPFANFRSAEVVGVHPVVGILIRCGDKFQRLRTFVECGELLVKGESCLDAVNDVINYMILAKGMLMEQVHNEALKASEEAGETVGECYE